MTAPLPIRLLLASFAAALGTASAARAQTVVTLEGSCTRLVIAGEDHGGACKGTLRNLVSRGRTSFDFSTQDGRTLSFSGNGAQQERTEETDPLQPINLVIPGTPGSGGVAQTPVLAVGACRFSNPEPGKTGIDCEATAPDGKSFAGSFVAASQPAQAAPKP